MGSTRCSGISVENNSRVSHTLSTKTATSTIEFGEQSGLYFYIRQNDSRNKSNAKPRYCRSSRSRTKLCLEYVSGPKERRVSATHLQLVSSKPIRNNKEISYDKCLPCPRFPAVQGLDVQNRFVTGIFSSTCKCVPQTIPPSSLQRTTVTNDLSTIRLKYIGKSVCFSDMANKPRQINNDTSAETHLSGGRMGYFSERKSFAKGKESHPLFQDLEYFESRICRSKGNTESSRSAQFLEFCDIQRQTSLSRPSQSPKRHFQKDETQALPTHKTSIRGSLLVAPEQSSTFLDSCATPVTFPRNRCLRPSLGSAVRQSSVFRTVDRSGTSSALQSERAPCYTESVTSPALVSEPFHSLVAK